MRSLIVLCAVLLSWPLPAQAQVSVTEAWVRGTVPGQGATGAFMKLAARHDTALVAVASPVAEIIEIHEMWMDGGVMRMRGVERLPIEAGRTVELKPSGYHIMMMALTRPVNVGDTVPITLTFEDRAGKRSTVEVKAPVRRLGDGAPKTQ
jgi:copper(I)-binding protein